MKMIALTGGIASGKSTIGRRFRELGAVVIDADQLARDAVAQGSAGLDQIVERFGEELLTSDGALDRPRLGALVFSDASALRDLNAIVHPEVRRLFSDAVASAVAENPAAVIVYEIPLLAETMRGDDPDREASKDPAWDLVVVAEAPVETRVDRMQQFRDMTEDEARSRIAHQASDEERRSIADVIIDTGADEASTVRQTDELWKRLRS